MLLYIVRHGDPIYNPDTLTPRGKAQAQALAHRFAVNGLDKIYTSPLGRAKETAQPSCDLLKITPQVEDWTQEVWGDFAVTLPDGRKIFSIDMPQSELRSPENIGRSFTDWFDAPCFSTIQGKEAYEKLIANSDAFLARHGYVREGALYRITQPNEERIAVFCHAGFSLTWLSHLLHVPPHIFWASFYVGHSSVSLLEFRNHPDGFTAPRCLALSDLSHLLADRLPYLYNNNVRF